LNVGVGTRLSVGLASGVINSRDAILLGLSLFELLSELLFLGFITSSQDENSRYYSGCFPHEAPRRKQRISP
jgi:hypothetical protein